MAKAAQKVDAAPEQLGEYRGKPIVATSGKFTNLGDGLSKAMEIEGGIDEQGELVTFVVRCMVGPHTLDLMEDGDAYLLVHKYVGGTVAKIDDDIVAAALNTMEARIKQAADERSKQITMPGVDEAADAARGPQLSSVKGDAAGEYHDTDGDEPKASAAQ